MAILTTTDQGLNFTGGSSFIKTGTSTVMSFNTSSEVGIGTDNPSKPLHVLGGDGGSGTHIAHFEGRSSVVGMYVRGDGRVGIGTTSPDGPLHLKYNNGTARSSVKDNNTVGLQIENTNSSGVAQIHMRVGDGDAHILVEDVGSNATDMFFSVDGTEPAMTIKNAGNVGIGTTSPDAKLVVAGIVDGDFTALRLMNQKTYGSGTGSNEKVRFVMGISESGTAFSAREGFAIDVGIINEGDSSNTTVDFGVRDGGVLGTYQTVNGHDKSVAFAGSVNINSVFNFNTSTDLLTITNNQNTGGIKLSGGNSRIYFGNYRAIEGDQSGGTLYIGEGYGAISLMDDVTVSGDLTINAGTSSSTTGVIDLDGVNGSAVELVMRAGNATTNRRAAIRYYSNQISTTTAQWVNGLSMGQTTGDDNFYFNNSANSTVLKLSQNGTATFGGTVTATGGNFSDGITFASDNRLKYSTTHWISPRDQYGNMHLHTSSGGIYLDSPKIYIREYGSTANQVTIDNGSLTATGTASFSGKVDFQGDAAIEGGSGYGVFKGYSPNDNHFISIRGVVATSSTLSITGGHQTTFVEHADAADEGWYFKSKTSGSYREVARIDGLGDMYLEGSQRVFADNYHPLDHAEGFKTYSGINASSAQARRHHIGRLYGCPAHWDGNWQNIELNVTAESYESANLRFAIMGDYNGGNQNTMLQLYLKEAHGPLVTNFRFVLGTPVDAGWDHSGQNTYYVDLYAEVKHYGQYKINIKTYGHPIYSTNPTSGAAYTVFYNTPTVTNISNFTETHSSSKHLQYTIWNSGNHGSGSSLDADLLDSQEGSYYQNASNLNAGTVAAGRLSTATTQSSSENSTKIATTAYVKSQGYITSANGGNAATLDGIDSTSFLRSDTSDTATGNLNFNGTQSWRESTRWQVNTTDDANQRADARNDDTDKARLHWYGQTDSGTNTNFRHAWYDGSAYLNVDVSSQTVTFDGAIAAQHLQVTGEINSRNNTIDDETLFAITDHDTDASIRAKFDTTSTAFTKVDDSTAPASGVFKVTGSQSPTFGQFIPIDNETEITFECWVKHVSGSDNTGNFYAGSSFFNGSKTYLGNNARYWGSNGHAQDSDNTTWRHIKGVMKGSSIRANSATSTAQYLRMLVLFNYAASGNASHFCGLRFYRSKKTVSSLWLKTSNSNVYSNSGFHSTEAGSAFNVIDTSGNIRSIGTIGVTQSDGDYLAKLYQSSADGFLELFTGQATPTSRTKITSYGDSYINPSNGNVSIGTTSPFTAGGTAKLSVSGLISWGASSSDLSYFRRLSAGNFQWQTYNGGNSGNIHLQPYGGNVGIGTTNPTTKLYIEDQGVDWNVTTPGTTLGTLHLDPVGNGANNTGNAITFGASDSSSGGTAQAGIYIRSDGNYGTKMYLATTNSYSSGSKTRLMIDHNGNVGIGTTGPAKTLDVVGEVRVSQGDLEIAAGSGEGLILKSPNGGRYRVTVNNSGELQTASI